MTSEHKHRLKIAILALTLTFAALALMSLTRPSDANAHTVTKKMCQVEALRRAQDEPPATLEEWRAKYRKCMTYAKKHNLAHICQAGVITVHPARVKGVAATPTQQRNIARSVRVGYKMNMTVKEITSMMMAITVETRARNLDYGHSSSVGILQLLNIHGSHQWRMVIENSVGWYFRGVRTLNTKNMTAGEIAGRVQRPAVRSVYAKYEAESTRTVRTYLGPLTGCLRAS